MADPILRDAGSGSLVVFEGIDGAGTTTQAERFAQHLRAKKRMVHVTREPSNGPIGALIRQVLTHRVVLPSQHQSETMALLFAADRLDHVAAEIEPHLRDGTIVVTDRYDLSSAAYQSVTADLTAAERGRSSLPPSDSMQPPPSGADVLAWIRSCNRWARRPDVTVIVHVDPDVAAQRRRARSGAAELFDDPELQARLARAYRTAEHLVPGDRLVHVEGGGSVEQVAADILKALAPFGF